MKKKLMLLILSVLAGVMTISVSAIPEEPKVSAAPAISFQETAYSAGEVWVGETVSHTFTFTNTGDADLEIGVKSCCGAVANVLPGNRFAPGESGEVQASFRIRRVGRQVKAFTVSSNDPKTPKVQLQIEVMVKNVAAFSPPDLEFGQVNLGEEAVREVKLVYDSEPLPIAEVSARPDFFQVRKVEMEKTGAAPGEARTVRIEVALSPEAPVGNHSGTLTVRFDRPGVHNLTGRLIAEVRDLIEHSP